MLANGWLLLTKRNRFWVVEEIIWTSLGKTESKISAISDSKFFKLTIELSELFLLISNETSGKFALYFEICKEKKEPVRWSPPVRSENMIFDQS